MPSLRGVPRRPSASITVHARYCALEVCTMKVPSGPRWMSSTFSRVLTCRPARPWSLCQNLSSSSLEILSFPNLPCSGNSTGLVITSFWRGYFATVPPNSSCSSVTWLNLRSIARSEALIPPGPAPTTHTSCTSGTARPRLIFGSRAAIVSTQSRPWLTAFLISARPPSSPTMNMFATLVSCSAVRAGMSAPTLGLAMTIVMAPTGHASAHSPCPMHLWPLTITALPAMTAMTSPSGQTSTQAPQPMHCRASMCGCCARGPSEKSFPCSAAARAAASFRRMRRRCDITEMSRIAAKTAYIRVVFMNPFTKPRDPNACLTSRYVPKRSRTLATQCCPTYSPRACGPCHSNTVSLGINTRCGPYRFRPGARAAARAPSDCFRPPRGADLHRVCPRPGARAAPAAAGLQAVPGTTRRDLPRGLAVLRAADRRTGAEPAPSLAQAVRLHRAERRDPGAHDLHLPLALPHPQEVPVARVHRDDRALARRARARGPGAAVARRDPRGVAVRRPDRPRVLVHDGGVGQWPGGSVHLCPHPTQQARRRAHD